MLTQDVTQELERVFQELTNQGKEPTVALVRARLSSPIPMPAIIASLKRWKSTKKVPRVEIAQASEEQTVETLQKQIDALTLRVEQLERQLNKS
ncbi:hypothetical protein [Vibrio sonorensis]|uniref:hypothetical protein n=1 Tax=Vibrio sonorensis TaxID=1004316 RepID=UPI0008DAD9FF|nr:hypothetical protein [Vibrio sonorensis]